MTDTKKFILNEYKKYQKLLGSNEDIHDIINEINIIKNNISLAELQLDKTKYSHYNDLLSKSNERYLNIMKIELSDLYIKFPSIFEMIVVNNIKKETLEHVLNEFEKYKKEH